MPLARIITTSADDSLELSMQLRSRGYRVETVAPGHVPSAPADLEVCLEECAPEDVLTKAAVVQESEDLWVFVAPGALDERSRPMRVIPLTPQVVEIRTPEHAAAVAALKFSSERATVEEKIPAAEKTKPPVEVQIPGVVVKEVVLAPEDDLLLCELEPQAPVAMPAPTVAKVEEISTPRSVVPLVAPGEAKPAEVILLPVEVKAHEAIAPAEVKSPAIVERKPKPAPDHSLEHIKKLAVVQQAAQIPTVPERVEPRIVLYKPAPPKPKQRGPWKTYKVAFQSGPKLWRTASVTVALIVLAGLVATVVAVRPPQLKKGTTPVSSPAIFLPAAQASTEAATGTPAAVSKPVPAKPAAQRAVTTPRRSASDDGLIAEDTVVFYNRKPAHPSQAKVPPPASGAKRYSDAD